MFSAEKIRSETSLELPEFGAPAVVSLSLSLAALVSGSSAQPAVGDTEHLGENMGNNQTYEMVHQ